jgi:hypothetical protein
MPNFFRHSFVCGLMLIPGLPGMPDAIAANPAGGSLGIAVRVYNYANVPQDTLVEAKREASRLLRLEEIEIAWFDCARNPAEAPDYPACEQISGGPTVVSTVILSRSMARRYPVNRSAFGFALAASKNGFAERAHIFFHRAEDLAARKDALGDERFPSLAVILGHVIAHEIGHLLIGWNHWPTGLMRAEWRKPELRNIGQGKLGFTPRQGELARAGVLGRVEAAAAGSVPVSGPACDPT